MSTGIYKEVSRKNAYGSREETVFIFLAFTAWNKKDGVTKKRFVVRLLKLSTNGYKGAVSVKGRD